MHVMTVKCLGLTLLNGVTVFNSFYVKKQGNKAMMLSESSALEGSVYSWPYCQVVSESGSETNCQVATCNTDWGQLTCLCLKDKDPLNDGLGSESEPIPCKQDNHAHITSQTTSVLVSLPGSLYAVPRRGSLGTRLPVYPHLAKFDSWGSIFLQKRGY